MAKALVIYGSTTGNTESTAHTIAKAIAAQDISTTVKDVTSIETSEFDNAYDLFVLGSSTWGDDEIELQEDFAVFYEHMDGLDLNGKKMAVFGCGDSSYPHFCGAVDAIEEKVGNLGADLVVNGLRIDGDPEDSEDEIVEWAQSVASAV
jgi:flavodoxin I